MRDAQAGDLEVEGFQAKFSDFSIQADFRVTAGERIGLVGPSGCGKTTLLRWIAGLSLGSEVPPTGRVRLDGKELTGLAPEKRGVGLIFQDQALFPAMSVLENVAFPLRMQGVSREERETQALKWLDQVGLKARAGAPVRILSGGERQRVAFLRAVIWKPGVLLLDEPFSALDSAMKSRIRGELKELHRAWPVPMLFVTHEVSDLEDLATGRIEAEVGPGGLHRFRLSP